MRKLLLIMVLFVVFLIWDFNRFLSTPVSFTANTLVVEQGMGFNDLREDLIKNNQSLLATVYYPLYIKLTSPGLKFGPHSIDTNATVESLIASLGQDPDDVRVRLPEGERLEVFAKTLALAGLGNEKDILACFKTCEVVAPSLFDDVSGYEGFLFPDTYVFSPASSPKQIVELLLKNFRNKFEPLVGKYSGFLVQHKPRDIVIIASLLEREAISLEDKRIVAGVLYNRIDAGMRLDVDATVSYMKGDWRSPITYEDLQRDSPYNTRKNPGLPPGPICNPGLVSLEAAMSPAPSSYLYYLTGNNGHMYYAKTLEEHNVNKEKFL